MASSGRSNDRYPQCHVVVRVFWRMEELLGDAMRNKTGSPLIWLGVMLIAMGILIYHAVIFISFEEAEGEEFPGAVVFSMFCNFVAITCLFSMAWNFPLSVLLGLDAQWSKEKSRQESNSWLQNLTFTSMRLYDPTTRYLLLGNFLAFLANETGELLFFLHGFSAKGQSEAPPVFASVVYLTSSITCSLVLAVGSGYVALAHNLFAVQLTSIAETLSNDPVGSAEHSPQTTMTGEVPLFHKNAGELELSEHLGGVVDVQAEERGSLLATSRESTVESATTSDSRKIGVAADDLAAVYFEFRRRPKKMSASLHPKLGFVFLSLLTETIIMVTKGYSERESMFSRIQIIALLCTFFGNSFALWSMIFSMGRVMYISREELGFAATKWALGKKSTTRSFQEASHDDASNVAQMVKDFPIKFHAGIFELNEDLARGITLLLMGLASIFIGVHLPQL